MRRILSVLFLAGLVVSVRAALPLRIYWGEQTSWRNARDLAFAGMNRFDPGPGAVFHSPAQLGFVDRPGVELSYGLKLSSEQRTRTVYDQFENAIGEVVVADNLGTAGIPGPMAGVFPLFGKGAVGVGIGPVIDFSYRYYKEFRDDFYNVIGEDRIVQSGTVLNAGLGFGFRPLSWLSLGASGGYMFGSRELESWSIRYPDSVYEHESGNPTGIAYSAGLCFQPLSRLSLDLGYCGSTELSNWQDGDSVSEAVSLARPWDVRFGISYQGSGILPSRVMAEVSYRAWSDVDTTYSNILQARAGVEHTMLNFLKLRYGFGVEPLPFDPSIQLAQVGAGVGFDVGLARIDVGAMFQRDVVGPSLFHGTLTPEDQRVYETEAVLAVTVSREF